MVARRDQTTHRGRDWRHRPQWARDAQTPSEFRCGTPAPAEPMCLPPRLLPLLERGLIDAVVRPLMSGKEAQVYLIESQGELRVAKVYKEANNRTFKNRSSYTEGRQTRNSRDQRAMGKGSRHGRERDEESWKAAEAEVIYKLAAAGVTVPQPFAFLEGVLVMACVSDADGDPAPRIGELTFDRDESAVLMQQLLREVVRMLCADTVHGDLSVYNILYGAHGPVVIDFPQAINAPSNRNARSILIRDVANLTSHFCRGQAPDTLRYAQEMWALYEQGELKPDTQLTGRFELSQHEIDEEGLMQHLYEVEQEEMKARARRGEA